MKYKIFYKNVIKGLLFSVHNAMMTVSIGNVTDNVAEGRGFYNFLRKEVF